MITGRLARAFSSCLLYSFNWIVLVAKLSKWAAPGEIFHTLNNNLNRLDEQVESRFVKMEAMKVVCVQEVDFVSS